MLKNIKKIKLLVLAAVLLLAAMSGCGGKSYKEMRLDISSRVYSLDPQFTTDSTSKLILKNTIEGLLVQRADGTLEPGVAETYEVADDGLTYTFHLREDAVWHNGKPVTAADFQFALRRLFSTQVPSPHAGEFAGIVNARQIMAGELDQEALGVEAPDDRTLVIRLEEASPLFLLRLAGTGALPCNREFFEGCRARYGLDKAYFLANGPFILKKWDNEKSLVLERNENYWDAGQVKTPSVTLYLGRENPKKQFLDGKSDCYQLTYEDLEGLDRAKFTYETRENTVWTLTFRQGTGALGDARVRGALVAAVDLSGVAARIPGKYTVTDSLVPAGAMLFQQPYRELSPVPQGLGYRPEEAQGWLREWMAETGRETVSGLSILIPQSSELSVLGGYLQKMWKDNLLLYVNLDVVDDQEYASRLASGNYQIALVAVASGAEGPQGTLASYLSGGGANTAGYANREYDQLLAEALTSSHMADAARLYARAEELLIRDAVALPLFTEPSYYAMGKGIAGVEFSGDGALYLKHASRG